MKKQIIASVLVLSSAISTSAVFAKIPQEAEGTRYEKAVSVLNALNIMNGDENGEYRLEDTIIRSELVKMAVTAMGMESAADSAAGIVKYDDVSAEHWASGYINLATSYGIIEGDGDGKFRPNDAISYREAVAVMVRAAGYESSAQLKGGYPNGYITVANENKMLPGVLGSVEKSISRGDVAILTNNTLEVKKMYQSGLGNSPVYTVSDKTLLSDNLSTEKVSGQITAVGKVTLSGANAVNDNEIMINEKKYNCDEKILPGYNVTAYIKKEKDENRVILILPNTSKNNSIDITAETFGEVTKKGENDAVTYYESENSSKSKTAVIDKNAQMIYNNRNVPFDSDKMKLDGKSAYMTLLDSDGNSVYDIVFVTEYKNIITESVSFDKIKGINGEIIDFDKIKYTLKSENGKIAVKDILKWDVLSVIKSPNDDYCEIYVTRKNIKGKISAINKDVYTVDNTAYKAAADFEAELKLGQWVELCLDMNGDIAAVKSEKTESVNYGYVTAAYKTPDKDSVEIKLVDRSSEKRTLSLANKVKFNGDSVSAEKTLEKLSERGIKQLITYTLNSSNALSEINTAGVGNFAKNNDFENSVYSSASSKLDNVRITDNTVVFDVRDESKIKVHGKNFFADKQKYSGAIYDMTESLDAGAVVIDNAVLKPGVSATVSVVKSISSGVNKDDEMIDIITLLTDGKEEKLSTVNDKVMMKSDNRKIQSGDVIQYKLNADKEIESVNVLFDISDKEREFEDKADDNISFVYGRVTKKFDDSLNIQVGGGQEANYKIGSEVAVYSVDSSNTKNPVSQATFDEVSALAGDRVFIRKINETVKELVIVK